MASKKTPLAMALSDYVPSGRPTPLMAFKLARRRWLEGKRLNLSALAEELGVGRATLMRWVGNRELLLGEILWSLYKRIFENAKENARAHEDLQGVEYLVRIYEDINRVLISAEPLKQFLRQDPQFGLQVLTSNVSRLQERLIKVWTELFQEEIAAGSIAPSMDPEDLAYFIVRIGEGAVYSDLICGREPVLQPASMAFRLLLTGSSDRSQAPVRA
jgi:AcrR family transcriptional regulator